MKNSHLARGDGSPLQEVREHYALERELVSAFADAIANSGLSIGGTEQLPAFIVAHELPLTGAGVKGSAGSADLLLVTADGRWWLIEAKLLRNNESNPVYAFGNQLGRYAAAVERLGLAGLHPYLNSYLYGRRAVLAPPKPLRAQLLAARDLTTALQAWRMSEGDAEPELEAARLVRALEQQIETRTLTVALLVDQATHEQQQWVKEHKDRRSVATLELRNGQACVVHDGLVKLNLESGNTSPIVFGPFDEIPQSYKPTPSTLSLVLSESAYLLYTSVIEPVLTRWTNAAWPEISLAKVTSSAFSVNIQSIREREVCLQIGRSDLVQGGTVGAHPLKLLVNFIWAAERVYEWTLRDSKAASEKYHQLEATIRTLCTRGQMRVRGIPKKFSPNSGEWARVLSTKLRGDAKRRPELVLVRELNGREDFGWDATQEFEDRRVLQVIFEELESWLGPGPYDIIRRRDTTRSVPGTVA